jgi:hypothetical protein
MNSQIPIENIDLLDPDCSVEDLERAAHSSDIALQIRALRHPRTPKLLKERLSSSYFTQKALGKVDHLLIDGKYKDVYKEFIQEYLRTPLPIALPNFLNYINGSVEDRKRDQWRGSPYTSTRWPWPKSEESGEFLSPAIQIDLRRASNLLSMDLGDGLLQVWFDEADVLSRIIPRSDMEDAADEVPESTVNSIYLFEYDESYYIEWLPAGIMFPRVIDSFAHLLHAASGYDFEDENNLNELIASELPVMVDSYFGCDNVYLGGYWHALGNEGGWAEWPEDPRLPNFGMNSRVLFQMWDSNYYSLLVVVTFNGDKFPDLTATMVRS